MLTKCKQLSDRALASSGVTVASGTFGLLSRPDADVIAVTNAASCRFTRHGRRGKGVEIAASNSVAAYAYALDCCGIATNETAVIGGVSRMLPRGVDGQGRLASFSFATNTYAANNLNQYSSISTLRASAPPRETNPVYDADGNLVQDDRFAYAYDAENRMLSARPIAPSEGDFAVINAYDHKHRRVMKRVERFDGDEWQASETHTFTYDGCNIVLERIAFVDGSMRTVEYFWGNDLSGTEQGAGGVGGLLAVSIDGVFFIPCYDHNGNIVCYVTESGSIAALYVYDPYGNVIDQYGALADRFAIRFSTKYTDVETGLISYLRRFYRPDHGRWLNRDPIEEEGGENLYAFCLNNPILFVDALGNLSIMNIVNGVVQVASGVFMMKAGVGVTVGSGGLAVAGGVVLTAWGAMSIVNGVNTIMSEFGLSDDQDAVQVQIAQVVTERITGEPLSQEGKQRIVMAYTAADIVMSCVSIKISWQTMVKEKAIYTYAVHSSEDVMVQLDKTRSASLLKLTEMSSTIHLTGTLNGTSMSNGLSIIMDYKALWTDIYEESDAIFNPEY